MPKEGCRMTNVTFKSRKGIIYGMIAKGHANYKTEGEDILCASISALTQAGANYIMKLVGDGIKVTYKRDDKKGNLELLIHNINFDAADTKVRAIFGMLVDALTDISKEEEFEGHLKVEVKEDGYSKA